ncbi:hypothetical protein FACS1894217_02310 [Clostridia bacterium]|nr:hypothetical protein FACS1894217_02310 [Clostridia bacterium]
MRRILLICVFLAFLTACSAPQSVDIPTAARQAFAASAFSAEVRISADFGDRVCDFTVAYSGAADGSATIKVLEPKEIAGITARVGATQTSLVYDGLILELGRLDGSAMTPCDAAVSVVRALREGRAAESGRADLNGVACNQITYTALENGKTVQRQVWLDAATLVPLHAEILADGRRVVTCEFSGATIGE